MAAQLQQPDASERDSESFEYDLALSFAGEDRRIAEQLAQLLTRDGVRVFYDAHEKAARCGKDLYQHLQAAYREQRLRILRGWHKLRRPLRNVFLDVVVYAGQRLDCVLADRG